jgi:LemA protein
MNKMMVLGGIGLVVVVLLVTSCSSYNGLVGKSQAVDGQWGKVEAVYQRRADLIPNLVATVQGSANFEKATLEAVTNARASVGKLSMPTEAPSDPAKLAEYQAAQGALSSSLSRLLVVAENYPTLKSTEGFKELQAQLEGTENRITVEREKFNDVVRDYDTSVHSFPSMIFAGMFGFHDKPYFAADAGAQSAPAVKFDVGK